MTLRKVHVKTKNVLGKHRLDLMLLMFVMILFKLLCKYSVLYINLLGKVPGYNHTGLLLVFLLTSSFF